MLKTYRRHARKCVHRSKGSEYTKCHCPIWIDGELHGRRFRKALGTRDWGRAQRKLGKLEEPDAQPPKLIEEAVTLFLDHHADSASVTRQKYGRIMRNLEIFVGAAGIKTVDDVKVETLDAYRATRHLCPLTWSKELQLLRQFFSFAVDREWIKSNPAKKVKMPANVKPRPVQPYTTEEISRIITACDFIGQHEYERLRARAIILTMRYTGLAIQDASCLERDSVRDGRLIIQRAKTGEAVHLPVHPELQAALDGLPVPNGAMYGNKYYFWNGRSSRVSVAKKMGRTLESVFKLAGVEGAHAHRFRHTLATEILVNGGTAEDAANILGNSAAIIRQHYAKWTQAFQHRTSDLMQRVFGNGTPKVQTENRTARC